MEAICIDLENGHKTFRKLLFQLTSSGKSELLVEGRCQPSSVCDDITHTWRSFHDHRSPHGWMLWRHWRADVIDAALQPRGNEADGLGAAPAPRKCV